MGAGRRAAASMKRYLGLADPAPLSDPAERIGALFGLPGVERNFVRLRVA